MQKQEKQIKQIEKDKINIKNNENINKDINQNINDVMNGDIRENEDDDVNVVEGIGTDDEDVDKLLKQIKMVDLQMDSYLKDIDECIEMNENIEKHLVNNDYEEEQK